MTHSASATGALPCVGIHLDDPVPAGTLPLPPWAAPALPAPTAGAAVPGFTPARPPLSDEEDEEGTQNPGDDEEEEDEDEDEDEDDEGEESDEDGDEDDDDDDDEDDDDDDDEDEEAEK